MIGKSTFYEKNWGTIRFKKGAIPETEKGSPRIEIPPGRAAILAAMRAGSPHSWSTIPPRTRETMCVTRQGRARDTGRGSLLLPPHPSPLRPGSGQALPPGAHGTTVLWQRGQGTTHPLFPSKEGSFSIPSLEGWPEGPGWVIPGGRQAGWLSSSLSPGVRAGSPQAARMAALPGKEGAGPWEYASHVQGGDLLKLLRGRAGRGAI